MKDQAPPMTAGSSPQKTAKRLKTSVPELSAEALADAHATPRASNPTPTTCNAKTPAPIPSSQPTRASALIPTAASTRTAIRTRP